MNNNEPIRYMECCVCDTRWIELLFDSPSLECFGCGSSVIALEKNLKGEIARTVIKYGCRETMGNAYARSVASLCCQKDYAKNSR